MLELTIKPQEFYDEETGTFMMTKEVVLQLEHSLIAISKWEAIWHERFIDKKDKTPEQLVSYIRCMTINKHVPDYIYASLTVDDYNKINDYIENPMTATTFSNRTSSRSSEAISSELIYYWMVANNIPFECEKWHLNRLLTLINICGIKNEPPKKMGRNSIYKQNASLNAARRKAKHSKG